MRDRLDIALRPDILARITRIARIGLTYLVPFAMASWSAVQTLRP